MQMYIALPLALETAGTRCRAILIEEHFFDVLPENSGNFES